MQSADLIDQSCFNNFDLNQGSLVVSENAESFVENRMGTECLNETNRTVNRIDMNKPPMESELEGIKKSSSKQKDKTLDKDKYNDKRERTVEKDVNMQLCINYKIMTIEIS